MGGCYEETTIKANSDAELREEYRHMVEHVQYMSGLGGYSGTFAEKPKVTIINGTHDPTTKEDARRDCQDNNEKWGPSFAYYLGNDEWYVGGWCSS